MILLGIDASMVGAAANVSVLVITADFSLGARVVRALASTRTLQLLAQLTGLAEVPIAIRRHRPDLLLCDLSLALDPDFIALITGSVITPLPKLVLLAEDARSTGAGIPLPLAALLPLDLPPGEMAAYLHTLIEVPPTLSPPNKGRAPGVPIERSSPLTQMPVAPELERRTSKASLIITHSAPSESLADAHTGLARPVAITRLVAAVQRLGYPITVAVIDLRFARGSVVPTDATQLNRIERWIGTTLRLSVRDDDLVCRVSELVFGIALPGLHQGNHAAVLGRIEQVVLALDLSRLTYGLRLDSAFGIGYWEPGLAEQDLLAEACNQARQAH